MMKLIGDVADRMQVGRFNWRNVKGIICNRKVHNKLKGKFSRTTTRLAMLYDGKCWALKGQQECKVGVVKIRMLR